jgi:hypothetical protein
MKIIRSIVSAALLWGLVISCNDGFSLFPDDTPNVLYVLGCLDGTGGVQQVKIRKMIHGTGMTSDMINDPSFYLPDNPLNVSLLTDDGRQYFLEPVLYPPQTGGPFSQDSNLVYELTGFYPSPGQTCTLMIEDTLTGKTVHAATLPLAPASFSYPVKESVLNTKFDFNNFRRPFHISYNPASIAVWTISLKYMDFMTDGDNHCRKATFCGQPGGSGGREFTTEYLTNIFKKLIPEDPLVNFRMFYRFDFTVWTGDGVLAHYRGVSGRFTDNRKLSADNIEGGMGLFYSTSHALLKNVCPKEKFCEFLADTAALQYLKFSRIPYTGIYTDPDSSLINPFSFQK